MGCEKVFPMTMRTGVSAAMIATGLVVAFPGTSDAVVNHPVDDGAIGTLPAPASAVVGRWDVDASANASAVAIGPNHILTTRHQNTGIVGSIVEFGGTRYRVAQIDNIGTADLRVCRLEQEFSVAPANLGAFTPLFAGDDDPPPTLPFTMGGFGRGRGTALLDPSSDPYGYLWDGTPANVNQTSLRFGRNVIEAVGSVGGTFPSDVLVADFDRPGVGGALVGESILAEFDSGGGWFVEVAPGQWRVAALSLGVDHTGDNIGQLGGRSLFAEFDDADTAAPDLLVGVRLSSYAGQINALVPEPTGAALLAGAVALASTRRRRS